jgi:hypothetical protein
MSIIDTCGVFNVSAFDYILKKKPNILLHEITQRSIFSIDFYQVIVGKRCLNDMYFMIDNRPNIKEEDVLYMMDSVFKKVEDHLSDEDKLKYMKYYKKAKKSKTGYIMKHLKRFFK